MGNIIVKINQKADLYRIHLIVPTHLISIMISVEKAKKLIVKNTKALQATTTTLEFSLGSILAEKVIAPISLPPFNQSAMDGYAFVFSDYANKKKIRVVGEVAAGSAFSKKIIAGQAVRIFTGAPIPLGADTVVMQEKVLAENDSLIITDTLIKKAANIRKLGSQIKKGDLALAKGMRITPGAIGYLSAMGIAKVKIIARPKVTIVVTGSELKKPGARLGKGEIYESNSFSLQAVLQSIGINTKEVKTVSDNFEKTFQVLKQAFKNSDLVLITGGISVGKYDFVGKALEKLGVKNIFYKIKQKPGKPLFFGKKNTGYVFGLPGNPAAVLSCFYEYVYPAINCMSGNKDVFLKKIELPIAANFYKKQGLSLFLKGKIKGNSVLPLEGQESYILSSFATADCIIYLPEECESKKAMDAVEVHLLPGLY